MSAGSHQGIADAKRAVRSERSALRARIPPEVRAGSSRAIADRLDRVAGFREARVVALYAPLATEVDALELARRVIARGAAVVFPRAVAGERRLAFAACAPEDLARGPFGAGEPPAACPEVSPAEIGCVVVPGIAFSEDGHRLGRGGGHYDATLASMPAAARIGVAFDVQVVPSLPLEPHDALLDVLVTESRTLRFARDSR